MSDRDPFGWVGATLEGKVRIEEVVGEGGFGVVYRGHHLAFEEPVAVKCLKVPASLAGAEREKFHQTFLAEGRLLHRLSRATAGIVQALDMGAATSPNGAWTPYLVLEWLHGSSLDVDLAARRSRGEGGRTLADAVTLLDAAARALDVAHAQGVAHRDVKPANLFLATIGDRRTLKVLDFGIAKVLGEVASVTQALAETGGSVKAFTPQYGAPEQFNRRFGATGPWTDVFALTLVLVELVAGKAALDGGDTTQLYIVSTDAAHRPTLRASGIEVPDAVEEVVRKALAVDPRDRYHSAGELWDALVATLPAGTIAAGRASADRLARTAPATGPSLSKELESMPTAQFLSEVDADTAPAPAPAAEVASSERPIGGLGAEPPTRIAEAAPTSAQSRAMLAATEPDTRPAAAGAAATTGPVVIPPEQVEPPAPLVAQPQPQLEPQRPERGRRVGLWIGVGAVVSLGAAFLLVSRPPPPAPPPSIARGEVQPSSDPSPSPPSATSPATSSSVSVGTPHTPGPTSAGPSALQPPTWGTPTVAEVVPGVPPLDRAASMDHASMMGWAQGAFGYCQDGSNGGARICLFRRPDQSTPVIDVDKNPPAVAPVAWQYGDDLFLTWTVVEGSDKPPKQAVLRIGARVRGEPGAYPIVIGGSKPAHRQVHPEAIALSSDAQYLGAIGRAHGEGVKDELYVHVLSVRELAGRAYNDAGYAHHKKGEYARAAELFHKAAFADPHHPNAAYNLACAYARLGDARAEGALALAVERDPDATRRKARTDEDLASVRGRPWFAALVGAGSGGVAPAQKAPSRD